MYPPAEDELDIDKQVEGLDPSVGEVLPDEMLSDEIDGQIMPEEEVEEVEEEEEVVPEEVLSAIKGMVDNFDRFEQPTRERMIRFWKKCELFFKGIQNIYWDYTAKDYRVLDPNPREQEPNEELDLYYQDKIVNIFRAHAESVISALSQDVPTVIFPPEDAENQDDLRTSKGKTKAAELLQKCNDAQMKLMYAIYIMWCQGVVGAYNYNIQDEEFGTYLEPQYEDETVIEKEFVCGNCGGPMTEGEVICPNCGAENSAMLMNEKPVTTQVYTHDMEVPKKREKIEFYGPLHFKIPHYVTDAKHTPYVDLETECHIDYVRELFPNLEVTEEYDLERYDRWARTSTDYNGELPQGLVTLRRIWLRPWTFNAFKKNQPEVYEYLRANFPSGAKVTFVNEKVARIEDENLDDHWTFTKSPLSSHLHAEPLGAPLLPIQDMRNELVVLKLQTIEYGIPETFADPAVLDFDAYNNSETSPGMLFPAKAPAGQSLDSGFTTLQTANFPKEAVEFQKELDADGQFVTGAFPSIYGGSMPSASKTAAEYSMSRNQALQRLQTTWKIVSKFWAEIMDKSVNSFIANLTRDEQFAVKKGGSYINVYIRQAELQGRTGKAEPEIAQTFPMSWMQKKDLLTELMQLNNEYINEALFHPENASLVSQYMGFTDFFIPGEDSRTKQMIEIQKMLLEEPFEPVLEMGMGMEGMEGQEQLPPMNEGGMAPMPPQPQSSIPIDEMLDNHQAEFDACVAWLTSEIGLDAKETNPPGWMNVRLHAEAHFTVLQAQLAMQEEAEAEESEDNEGESNEEGGDF